MRRAVGVLMVALSTACPVPASALDANSTILLSRPSGLGALPLPGDNNSTGGRKAISGDGRFVAFSSFADDLGVQDARPHVWVRDTLSGTTTLVDRVPGGGEPGDSTSVFVGAISRDGSTVCFVGNATNLVPGVTGRHAFVATLSSGAIVAIVIADRVNGVGGAVGNGDAGACVLDAIGTRVAFVSNADDLVSGDGNGGVDVFVRDLGAGTTERVSLDALGAEIGSAVSGVSMSADGRRVAFETTGALVGNDTNGNTDVYVRDLQAGTTIRASLGTGGVQGNGASFAGVINDDGGYVAFTSLATNFDPGDTNGRADVFWRTLGADTTILVSRATGGAGALSDGNSGFPVISGDGLGVAFESAATNLGAGPPPPGGALLVYLRRLGTDVTSLLSRASGAGAPADATAFAVSLGTAPTVSAWTSDASNLDPDASGEFRQVFKRDASGTTTLVSRPDGTGSRNSLVNASFLSGSRAVSADGRLVVFASSADGLDPAAADRQYAHVFVRDAVSNTTSLVSRGPGPAGAAADNGSEIGSIAASGSHVAFLSDATNLLPGVTGLQVYVRDLATGALEVASRTDGAGGALAAEARFDRLGISADGRRVVFRAGDALVSADGNTRDDVYVRDLVANTTTLVSIATSGDAGDDASSDPSLSDDGTRVAFVSRATNLLAGGPVSGQHVYVRDLLTGTTVLADRDQDGAPGADVAAAPEISGSGNRVVFFGGAPLTADTIPPEGAVFVRDLAAEVTFLASREDGPEGAAFAPDRASIDADGTRVALVGTGAGLPGGGDTPHAYLRDLAAGTTRLVSAVNGTAATPGDEGADAVALNGDGACVAFSSRADNLTVPAYPTREFKQIYLRAVDGGCLASATTSTTLVTTSTTLPPGSGTPIPAKTVVLRPGKLVKLVAKGLAAGALPDPTTAGGTLVVEGTTGSASFPLAASGWKAVGRREPKGFKFKGAGCRVAVLQKQIKATCRGATGGLALPEPGPVELLLVVADEAYCAGCGGTAAGKATRVFKRRACPAPATCP